MESLERLASSIAQAELLVASLKRENRDLSARLAAAAADSFEARADAESRLEALAAELRAARREARADPELEARAVQAETDAGEVVLRLAEAAAQHMEEKERLESLIRNLDAQVMAAQEMEQVPVASAEILEEARERELRALEGQARAQERIQALGAELKELQARLDAFLLSEDRSERETEVLKIRLVEQERRVAELEAGAVAQASLLEDARLTLVGAAKLEMERAELKRQKREAASFVRRGQLLRRKVEELLATLESARLG